MTLKSLGSLGSDDDVGGYKERGRKNRPRITKYLTVAGGETGGETLKSL